MAQNNYIMTTESDVLYDPARYTGIDQVVVDNDNDTIGLSGSFISTVNNKLDSSTFTAYTAAHAGDDVTPYTAGSNINITNHVVSGKDWSSDISNAVSGKLDTSTYNTFVASTNSWDKTPYTAGANINITNHVVSGKDWSSEIGAKLDTSTYNTYTAAHANDDVTPYTAGSNINITNHVVSGKDWSSDISNATSGKIDKITGGAGSETNPVYLNASNVVTPCFSGSVKLANTIPYYFSADAGSNIMLYAPNGSHKASGDSIRNSIFITNFDNYLTNTTTDKFEDCIFMGNCYMYSPSNAGTCSYEDNIIIGNNSISNAQNYTINNTVIGSQNDLLGNRGADSHKFQGSTFIGFQNNAYTDIYATTVVGCNNDVGNYGSSDIDNKEVQVSIFGYNNKFSYDSTNSSPTYNFMVGIGNNVESRVNYKCATVGFDNNLTGNCTFLIGDGLTATNEGTYENKIMKLGMGNTFLKVESSGSIKQVINGTAKEIQNKLTDITDVQVVNALPASPVANVLYLVKE